MNKTLSWFSIIRLGFVQMALGSVIVLTTSTLNRLMIVEGALPAVIPGLLVCFHYGIQVTRPAWGFFSDIGKTRTRWILIGMSTLSAGGILATLGTILIQSNFPLGLILSIIAYGFIGLGVSAAGTSLLAYLAVATKPDRRAAAASLTWLMMIFGIAVTAGIVGKLIDPFSTTRVITVISSVCILATLVTILAVYGVEKKYPYLNKIEKLSSIVGAKPSNKFKKINHLIPMLSLSNAFDKNDMEDFMKKINNFLNQKI